MLTFKEYCESRGGFDSASGVPNRLRLHTRGLSPDHLGDFDADLLVAKDANIDAGDTHRLVNEFVVKLTAIKRWYDGWRHDIVAQIRGNGPWHDYNRSGAVVQLIDEGKELDKLIQELSSGQYNVTHIVQRLNIMSDWANRAATMEIPLLPGGVVRMWRQNVKTFKKIAIILKRMAEFLARTTDDQEGGDRHTDDYKWRAGLSRSGVNIPSAIPY